ncbi:class F sortase [Nocardioides plantarum]|uniref:Sortase domain-bontaining protein n=1 Tax=Nocardioides plantarum TaxID=29299 RepID=A0ABV5K9H4_9ACTN|nr:class F sortase [Nocardioides plantarum]
MTSRTRPLPFALLILALVVGALTLLVAPPGGAPPATASPPASQRDDRPLDPPSHRRVDKDDCRRIDPNLVRGACLRYSTAQGSGLTWIGTYRAPDGRIFFCIDYLYDSRLPRRAERVSTAWLVNQLGRRVGDPEVAALNYVVSTWAARGSTGSDDRDAAIALIVREVMGDGTRPGGLVVYPGGLEVGETVRPPVGGIDARTLGLAQSMWRAGSAFRGPWRLRVDLVGTGPVRVGQVRSYRVAVRSAAGRSVPGVRVRWQCWGPTTCPRPVTTGTRTTVVRLRPTDIGRFRVVARVSGPASDAVLYRQRGWSTHGGSTARAAGVQRGWIAQSNTAVASVTASTRVEKAQPAIMTKTSHAVVRPGAAIHDAVAVKNLPPGYRGVVVAELHGPFAKQPGPGDCSRWTRAGRVSKRVTVDGTYDTPSVVVRAVGYYTWVQRLPGDLDTLPVTTPCGLRVETTRVLPRTPRITTVVSDQRAVVGARIHDTVRLRGLAADDTVTVRWRLHGPLAPAAGRSCARLRWSRAAVAGSGSMTVTGSRDRRTPSVVVRRAGCYTYSQEVLATPLTEAATSPPGLATETSLVVRRTPHITTVVSDQRALVGDRIHDTVRLTGLAWNDTVTVRWRLYGPIAPASSRSCAGLRWSGAPVAGSGATRVTGSRVFHTASVLLERPGCYTYSQRAVATATTNEAASPPGLTRESSLVTRPVTPVVPEVPTGRSTSGLAPRAAVVMAAPEASPYVPQRRVEPRWLDSDYRLPASHRAEPRAGRGGTLTVSRVGIRLTVASVGLDGGGAIAVPDQRSRIGWLRTTAAHGDLIGASVLSGHVSGRPGEMGALRGVRRGDVVRWTNPSGRVERFEVRSMRRYPRTRGVPAELFRTNGQRLVHLITCTTPRRMPNGRLHYVDNLVVTAVRLG